MTEITKIRKEWYLLFIEFLESINELDKWQMPFFKTYDASGKYEVDGDPIFSMINHCNTKIIKVIHEDDDPNFIMSDFDGVPMLICFSTLADGQLVLSKCASFVSDKV